MIFIFGDSHADFNFRGLQLEHLNLSKPSITMHRIGRDNEIINFNSGFCAPQNSFIFCYGEVDCRCHIGRQIATGRNIAEVCDELVNSFIRTIKNNVIAYKDIIICSITPPLRRCEYEDIHGPITHEFPFVGSDEERVSYTRHMNRLLEASCAANGFRFLEIYELYARSEDGTLSDQYSDGICHIKNNSFCIIELKNMLNT